MNAGNYKMCLDRVSFNELYEDSFVVKQRQLINEDKISISDSYLEVEKEIKTNDKYAKMTLGRMLRCKALKSNQVMQSVLARGYVTDVGGRVFPYPIKSCFFSGISNVYDFAIESRSATKSLASSNSLIGQAEYFGRKLRSICSYMEKVLPGDCGTTDYHEWFVKPYNEETKVRSDLYGLIGKFYLSDDGLKEIKKSDTKLIGTFIKIRAVKYCKHIKDQNVCSVCFGGMSRNTHGVNNIGYLSVITIAPPIAQQIMSIKHSDTIGSVAMSVLIKEAEVIFTSFKNGIKTKKDVLQGLSIIISSSDSPGMLDIIGDSNNERKRIAVKRMSSVRRVGYFYEDSPDEICSVDIVPLPSTCTFSDEFILHISKSGITFDNKGNYCIDMSAWDSDQIILNVPNVSHGKIEDVRNIQSLIEGRADNQKVRMQKDSAINMLVTLFDAVSSAINVNLSIVEIVMTAISIDSYEDMSISLPDGGNRLGQIQKTMAQRSLGPVMGMELRRPTLMSANSHSPKGRMSNAMDSFLLPHETVNSKK